MQVVRSEQLELKGEGDVVGARRRVAAWADELGFSATDRTKAATAASELARNAIVHARGGTFLLSEIRDGGRRGLRMVVSDHGPGIPDVARALQDGFTTGGGLGLGLGGARRLVDEFEIDTAPGRGTRITVARWR